MKTFAIIGAGWRSEFFLRAAAGLPAQFAISSICSRTASRAQALAKTWNVPFSPSIEETLQKRPDFVVVIVPWGDSPNITAQVAAAGIPVLCETPPATSEEDLAALHSALRALPDAKVQIAEQYFLQPLHATRLEVIRRGWIGTPSYAHVSVAHGYHGISLMRRYLDTGFSLPTITARAFHSPIVEGPGRNGPPRQRKLVESGQILAQFDWEGKLGLFDFADDQYFSWIRGSHLLVRGENGEIQNEVVRRLLPDGQPVTDILRRESAGEGGNLEGQHLKGYTAGGEWLYRNPAAPARLSDDEIAVAGCLQGMADYIDSGKDFYSLKEAMLDRYLDIHIQKALDAKAPVSVPMPAWL